MTHSSRLEPTSLDVVLSRLLANNPKAPVYAIQTSGVFTAMPPSVPLTTHRVLQGQATALDLVVPADAIVVIDAWTRARKIGAARASVHLRTKPEHAVVLHFVDATHRHGVFVGLFEMDGADGLAAVVDTASMLRPRVGVMYLDELAQIRRADEASAQMLGWSSDELVGRRTLEFIDPQDHGQAIGTWMDMLRMPGSRRRTRLRHRARDGSWTWFEVTTHNLLNDPAHGYVVREMVDITDEMAAQEALRAREHLLRRLTEALPVGICQIDAERRIVYRNARLTGILGQCRATSLDKQLASVLPRYRPQIERALDQVLVEGRDVDSVEVGLRRRAKDVQRCTLSFRALSDESGAVVGAILCVVDVTESVRLRQQLEDRATFDVLTRCHNRASILDVLTRALAASSQTGAGTSTIFVDLDRFKAINDQHGHAAGDAFLVETAQRLARAVRGRDVVGRIGGDEFLVVCTDVKTPAEALQIAERISVSIAADLQLDAHTVTPRASIGVVWSNRPELDADTLVARADQAMYESKRQRRGRPVLVVEMATQDSLSAA